MFLADIIPYTNLFSGRGFVHSSSLGQTTTPLYLQASARLGGAVDVTDQVDHTGAVSPLVVVPGHKLDEVVVQSNPSLGIKDAGPVIGKVKT
jgi:hypothetical protein